MPDKSEYQKMLTDFVQQHMIVLGPNIALDAARKVAGLEVAEDGQVTGISGDSKLVLKSLAQEYSRLSEFVSQTLLNGILEKYPDIISKSK